MDMDKSVFVGLDVPHSADEIICENMNVHTCYEGQWDPH